MSADRVIGFAIIGTVIGLFFGADPKIQPTVFQPVIATPILHDWYEDADGHTDTGIRCLCGGPDDLFAAHDNGDGTMTLLVAPDGYKHDIGRRFKTAPRKDCWNCAD